MNDLEVELTRRLVGAVPPPPEGSVWGRQSRDLAARWRRRRMIATAGVTSVVALVAVILVPGLTGNGNSTAPTPGPVDGTRDPGLVAGCPDPGLPLPYPAEGRLRTDPVGVRLCNVSDDRFGVDYDVPADELTLNPQVLAEQVNDLQGPTGGVGCNDDRGGDVALWFRYPDGTAQAVRYTRFGCHELTLGGEVKRGVDGESLLLTFNASLATQHLNTYDDSPGNVTIRNETGEVVWIVLPFGNRASIDDGKSMVTTGPCGYRPLRAETDDGTVLDYFAGPCATETWTLTSATPYPPDDPYASGVLQGDLVAVSDEGTTQITHGGITLVGPVIRTVSVDSRGHFELRLPAGIYAVRGGSTVLPGGGSDLNCQPDEPVPVDAGQFASIIVTCG
jgi:hypothetical protein